MTRMLPVLVFALNLLIANGRSVNTDDLNLYRRNHNGHNDHGGRLQYWIDVLNHGHCGPTMFTCPSNYLCLYSLSEVCDGKFNCINGADENHCTHNDINALMHIMDHMIGSNNNALAATTAPAHDHGHHQHTPHVHIHHGHQWINTSSFLPVTQSTTQDTTKLTSTTQITMKSTSTTQATTRISSTTTLAHAISQSVPTTQTATNKASTTTNPSSYSVAQGCVDSNSDCNKMDRSACYMFPKWASSVCPNYCFSCILPILSTSTTTPTVMAHWVQLTESPHVSTVAGMLSG